MTNTDKNMKNKSAINGDPSGVRKPLPLSMDSVQNSPQFIRNVTANQAKGSPQVNHVRLDNLVTPPSPTPSLIINRPVYNVREFNESYIPNETQKTFKEKIQKFSPDFSRKAWANRAKRYIPIFKWLPNYDFRQNLIIDIIVGITIASFQVPQSMGYALIAQVNPIYGLYTAFFPSLLYTIFGTSRHSSVGPVAVVAGLMTGNIVVDVQRELKGDYVKDNTQLNIANQTFDSVQVFTNNEFSDITNIDIACMVAIIDGIYVLIFGLFRLGFISNYLSEELVSGFMTSAALHVFTTQLHYLFGVHLESRSGILALPLTYVEFFSKITKVNLTALIISIICVSTLVFFKLVVERLFHKMGLKMPFPIHLFIIIGGCIASNLLDLGQNYQVEVVGKIPDKFPIPTPPKFFRLFKYIWYRCIPTAVVTFTQTLSIGRLYGNKYNYKIDPNQEMIAVGLGNLVGSFFYCLPCSASIPRSAVQEQGGGRTQIVSLVNCICILIVILVLSTLLTELPNCVLAACIAVALFSIISKFQEFINFIKISYLDGAIWLITAVGVVVLNLDYGIYIGFGCSLLLLIYKSQRPKTYSLGSVDNSDIYVPLSKFRRARELLGVKIYQFCGPLNFANVGYFNKELQTRSGVDVISIKQEMNKMRPKTNCFVINDKNSSKPEINFESNKKLPKYIIIDCSMLSYIDTSGVTNLKKLVQSHADISIQILLTGCPVHIETMLNRDGFFKEISTDLVFKSNHDAITYIRDASPKFGIAIAIASPNQNNLTRTISRISVDSFESIDNNLRIFDSSENILKGKSKSPKLTSIRPFRSETFSN